jgi:hypothetical protein
MLMLITMIAIAMYATTLVVPHVYAIVMKHMSEYTSNLPIWLRMISFIYDYEDMYYEEEEPFRPGAFYVLYVRDIVLDAIESQHDFDDHHEESISTINHVTCPNCCE